MIRLYISNGEYIKDEKTTIIIGTNNDLNTNKIKSTQLMPSIVNKNIGKYCRINGNVVEKSTFSKMKIKINKLTWTIINIIYFLTKDKSIFIKKIPGYDDYKYALNNEELESFAALKFETTLLITLLYFKN
ncbi:hypothetical protein [Spiroplasma endosymbiont of Ammophila pubescens]|uniref:hypothetical protein n=1 Tax=Spiroplasma endosymbiont of Ammophila pubescens TaxID=3066315 RepID=UPI0032B1B950